MIKQFLSLLMIFSISIGFSQNVIGGKVVDSETKGPLPGATIVVKGTSNGVVSGFDGTFSLNANAGDTLEISFLGYATQEVSAGSALVIELVAEPNVLGEIIVSSGVIDVAKVRETPVAVSTITPSEVALKVGNQEFPEIMNKTPGVYATKQGGGYGDSRITLRGFDQRNTSFLINGQPVNDMENGWVYWSNWAGLVDVSSGIQIQRGLGASRLAVPSVGGTVSIFTKAADRDKGGRFTQLIGNDGYSKTTFTYSTGKNDKGWASSYLLTKWKGDGYVDYTSGEGTTYFLAVGYAPDGSDHSFNVSVLGAGQWHHQRDVWLSIRDYQNFGDDGIDPRINANGGYLNGEEFSMRRNFYNKPLATVNWDWEISSRTKLATSFYASAGRGGGTGPRGGNFRDSALDMYPYRIDFTEHYLNRGRGSRNADGSINFDQVIATNRSLTGSYSGALSNFSGQKIGSNGFRNDGVNRVVMIRRASMNSHDWVGAISNLETQNDNWRFSIGIDLRSYKGYHYRALENLMGLDGYYSTGNRNSAGQIINTTIEASPFKNTGLNGPKIDYYNTGIVKWGGLNGLMEYSNGDKFTAVLQAGLSNQQYQREDFFDQPKLPISDKVNQGGGYLKGGANLNLNDNSNIFFNAGYIARQPNFDGIFPNYANIVNPDKQNEKITSLEIGYGYVSNKFSLNLNVYATTWGNRFISRGFSNSQGQDGTAQFKDIDVNHKGLEIEAKWRPSSNLKINGMVSIGDWRYTKDFEARLFDDNQASIGTATLYLKDAKVGDAAQFTSYFEIDYRLSNKFNVDFGYRFADNLYADYSITDSDFTSPDNDGAVKLPSYGLADLGMSFYASDKWSLRANINNLFNTTYIAESNSNIHASSGSQTWKGIDVRNYVWFGFGTTWNLSLKYRF
jgi:outer membrane receptor protein involved in Fe transport